MKLKSNGVGQLRTLFRTLMKASSPVGGTVARRSPAFSPAEARGPKGKTFKVVDTKDPASPAAFVGDGIDPG